MSPAYPNIFDFAADESVDLKAVPSPGYRFVNWSGDLTGNRDSVAIVMDCNKNITANFTDAPSSQFPWWWVVAGVAAIGVAISFLASRTVRS